jgi:bacterial/archaeal transporter family protein
VSWLGFALLAMGFWGMWGLLSKVATQYLPPMAVYVVAIFGNLAVVGYLLAGPGISLPWHTAGMAAALGAGVCGAFGLLCFYRALAGGAAAVVVPLTALYPLVTVVLSLALLREGITLRHLAGVALALAAVWLLSK